MVAALDAVWVVVWVVIGIIVIGFFWAELIYFSELQLLALFDMVIVDYVFFVTGNLQAPSCSAFVAWCLLGARAVLLLLFFHLCIRACKSCCF